MLQLFKNKNNLFFDFEKERIIFIFEDIIDILDLFSSEKENYVCILSSNNVTLFSFCYFLYTNNLKKTFFFVTPRASLILKKLFLFFKNKDKRVLFNFKKKLNQEYTLRYSFESECFALTVKINKKKLQIYEKNDLKKAYITERKYERINFFIYPTKIIKKDANAVYIICSKMPSSPVLPYFQKKYLILCDEKLIFDLKNLCFSNVCTLQKEIQITNLEEWTQHI